MFWDPLRYTVIRESIRGGPEGRMRTRHVRVRAGYVRCMYRRCVSEWPSDEYVRSVRLRRRRRVRRPHGPGGNEAARSGCFVVTLSASGATGKPAHVSIVWGGTTGQRGVYSRAEA